MAGVTSLTISRTELGLAPLQLVNPAGGYTVPGGAEFMRGQKEMFYGSPSTSSHYSRPRGWTQGNGSYELPDVRITGTKAERATRLNTLTDALDQLFFTVTVTDLGGTTRSWRCISADWNFHPDTNLTRTLLLDGTIRIRIEGPHMGPAS